MWDNYVRLKSENPKLFWSEVFVVFYLSFPNAIKNIINILFFKEITESTITKEA